MSIGFSKYFSLFCLSSILNTSVIFNSYPCSKIDFKKNCTDTTNIDSLKWMMYALNFEMKAVHFKYDYYPEFDIVQCDINYYFKDTSYVDTTVYYFSFFKGTKNDIYIPKSSYKSGIGFSAKSKKYFPVSNHFFPQYIKDSVNYERLFIYQEKKFIDFLINYKGKLSDWLMQEARKRKVFQYEG